jgi:predicted molibdopterin-dependent oxidoreductase YjgC
MSDASPFEQLDPVPDTVTFTFDGAAIAAADGANLAAALLAAGVTTLRRTPVSAAPRGPFCMMGACYDCLVEIDGERVQACMQVVRDGLAVTRPAVPEGLGDA